MSFIVKFYLNKYYISQTYVVGGAILILFNVSEPFIILNGIS